MPAIWISRGEFLIDRDLLHRIIQRQPDGKSDYEGERTLVFNRAAKGEKRNLVAANLAKVDLRRVDLRAANLQGAYLGYASFEGAYLSHAQLKRADLWQASFKGAILEFANLQGAIFGGTGLQGANFENARLQVAVLSFADLRGAILEGAYLQGADLRSAMSQGADIVDADIRWSRLTIMDMWLARGVEDLTHSFLEMLKPEALSPADFDELTANVEKRVEDIEVRFSILTQLEHLDQNEDRGWDIEVSRHTGISSTDLAAAEQILLEILREIGCGKEHRRHIAGRLAFYRIKSEPAQTRVAGVLAREFLGAAEGVTQKEQRACPGAAGISEAAKKVLH